MDTNEQQNFGDYLTSFLQDVDLVPAGFLCGRGYGASIKLRFVKRVEKIHYKNGFPEVYSSPVTIIITVQCLDNDINFMLEKYKSFKGKEILISDDFLEFDKFVTLNNSKIFVEEV